MGYKCILVDDEPIARRVIHSYLMHFPQYEVVNEFDNAYDTLRYLDFNKIDLLFLDIKMPGLNGLDFLRTVKNSPKVILITAYRDFALEGFELEVLDYLLKPVSEARFIQALQKFEKTLKIHEVQEETEKIREHDHILLKAERKTFKIAFAEIEMIESKGDYIEVFYNGKSLQSKVTISSIEQELPVQFVRTHRSFIINTQFLKAFTAEEIELKNYRAPVGRSYREEVLKRLS